MKRFIALVLSLVMALSLCAPAWAVDATTMTLDEFIAAVKEGAGTYDGNGVTVKWTDDSTADNYHNYDQVNNTYTGQYYDFFGDFDSFSTAVSADYPNIKIANVNFEFVPSGTVTTAEFQLYSTGNIEFVGCSFDKVSVDPWGNTWGSDNVYPESATFTNCTFKNIANRYAIHQSRAKTLIVNGCTFESCRSGIHVNPVTNLTVTNNTFTGISDGHGVLCLAEGITTTPTSVNVSGNKAEGQVMLRQLSSAVTYAQVSSILDTTKNTYGTAYVTGSIVPAAPIATADGVPYTTLQAAVDAVKDGGEIKLLDNVTFDENTRMSSGGSWYEGLYYTGDKSFTVDLNGKTITNDSSVNDYLLLFKNTGSKANTITFKNGTIEAASSAYCAICTATTSTQKITINLEKVNLIGNNSNGAVAKIRGGAVLNVKADTVITGKDSYVCIEAVGDNTVVNVYDGAELYQKGTSSYVGSLVGVSYNATVNVYGGYGESAKGAFIAMTSGGTINVSGGEWIANTDGTYANDNKSVLIAQNDKNAYANAGKSIVNVTGGAFKAGYNCYGNAVGDAQINISGGYFNTDPSAYCADGYICAFNSDAKVYTVQKKGAAADNGAVKEDVTENLNNAAASDAVVDAVQQTTTNTVTVAETTIELTDAGKTAFQTAIAENKADPTNKPLEIETEIAISDVTDTLAAAVQDELKDELKDVAGDDAKVAAILDIDIHVFVNDQHVGQLTELPQPITITLDLPEIEEELKDGYRRSYFVIIHHDGEAEKIPATVSGDKLIITSDRFSPYALGYVDTEIPAGGYYPYYPPTTTPDSELVKSPDTFDAGIALYVGVSVMGAIGTVVLGKKRED